MRDTLDKKRDSLERVVNPLSCSNELVENGKIMFLKSGGGGGDDGDSIDAAQRLLTALHLIET